MRRFLTFVIVAAVVFVASAAGAQTTINACVKSNNGQARLVSATEPCGPSETKVSWNVTGPKGDPGDAGTGGNAIRVVDANGIYIGDFAGGDFYANSEWFTLVTRKENGFSFALAVKGEASSNAVGYMGALPAYGGYERAWYIDAACTVPGVKVNPASATTWGAMSRDLTTEEIKIYYPIAPPQQGYGYYITPASSYYDYWSGQYIVVPETCRPNGAYGWYATAAVTNLGRVVTPFRFER